MTSFLDMLIWRLKGKQFLYEIYFRGKKTLDIGCGEGEFIKNDPSLIVGLEPNPSAVDRLQAKGYIVTQGALPSLPFENESFEGIHSRNVIEHLQIPDAYSLFTESVRLLKKGGILVVASETVNEAFWDTFGHIKPYPPKAIRKLFRDESREEFARIDGLEEIETIYVGQIYKNKILYLISCFIAFHMPLWRREYLMVFKRV